jgi:hypothetical protein
MDVHMHGPIGRNSHLPVGPPVDTLCLGLIRLGKSLLCGWLGRGELSRVTGANDLDEPCRTFIIQ